MQSRRDFLKAAGAAVAALSAQGAWGQASNHGVAGSRPNILFAIADDQSFPHAGAYGCNWVKTPAFDHVAKQGILFANCYTPNAKCAPSRSCIVTGRNPWQLEEACNHVCFFPPKFKTYCEALDEHTDYVVGYTGKGVQPVIARTADGAPRNLTGKAFSGIKTKPPASGVAPTDYAANFEAFLENVPEGSPFCFWYGGYEPHRPYEYESGVTKGGKALDQIHDVPDYWPDNETVRNDMLDYAYEIEYFDSHLGKMMEALEARGKLDNTIIVVTADNGMPFPRAKGIEYEISNHMPLAVMWLDGIERAGRVVDDYVSFIDFAPTFLELAGMHPEASGMHPIQGQSLMPILLSPQSGHVIPERDHVLLGQERHDVGRPDDVGYPVRSIIKDGFLYVHNFEPSRWPMCDPQTGYLNTDGSPTKTVVLNMRRDGVDRRYWDRCFGKKGSEELYHIEIDPDCVNNLAGLPGFAEKKNTLKTQLFAELKEQGDPRMFGHGDVFDTYHYAGEQQRDFYNRYMRGEIKEHITGWVNPSDFEPEPVD